jgi:hypothetical protein
MSLLVVPVDKFGSLFELGTPGKSYVALVLRLRRIPGVPAIATKSRNSCHSFAIS